MQPAQLSLLPEQTPAPPTLLAHLPEAQLAAAIIELARLIANAATAMRGEEVDDD
jgi:hypothetical protein